MKNGHLRRIEMPVGCESDADHRDEDEYDGQAVHGGIRTYGVVKVKPCLHSQEPCGRAIFF
jgi:hypothetical protein